jgi:nucleoid DNA-binding protein
MNLSKLIHKVWSDETIRELGLRKGEVKTVIEVMVKHIVKGLLEEGIIKIRGLFTLDIREVKGRKIRHPITKEIMYSSDYFKVGVEPSKTLKDGLLKMRK